MQDQVTLNKSFLECLKAQKFLTLAKLMKKKQKHNNFFFTINEKSSLHFLFQNLKKKAKKQNKI